MTPTSARPTRFRAAARKFATEVKAAQFPGRFFLSIVALGILALVCIVVTIPLLSPSGEPLVHFGRMAATPTSSPIPYANDLYHFSITVAAGMQHKEVNSNVCRGTLFAPEQEDFDLPFPPHPRLSICYLEPSTGSTIAFLHNRLDRRIGELGAGQWIEAQMGLPKAVSIGPDEVPGVEYYVRGTDATTGRAGEWYEAMLQFEGRLYQIEAAGPVDEWNGHWPVFRDMINNSLRFESGIISPP